MVAGIAAAITGISRRLLRWISRWLLWRISWLLRLPRLVWRLLPVGLGMGSESGFISQPAVLLLDLLVRRDAVLLRGQNILPVGSRGGPISDRGSSGRCSKKSGGQAPSELMVYPKNGQSQNQQITDRYECYRWAVSQLGYDPTSAGGDTVRRDLTDYNRAQTACLEARGYSVK